MRPPATRETIAERAVPRRVRRALRRRRRSGKRGVALIMVLGALTILTVMLTEFQEETAAELGSAVTERDQLKAEYAARSAVNLSRLLIAAEPTIRKSLAIFFLGRGAPPQIPVWEYADRVLGAFNDDTGTAAFAHLASVDVKEGEKLGMEGAGFEVDIVDEDSKINLNTPARNSEIGKARLAAQLIGLLGGPQYNPLFENRDADGQYSDRQTVCAAIVDWTDVDQQQYPCDPHSGTAQQTGPEDSFYQLLKDGYPRKNAAFDSLEELRLVRGVGDDFWATFVEPDHDKPGKRTLTVWGQGKVNVNTANAQTVWALICGYAVKDPPQPICVDPLEAAKFMAALNMVQGFTAGVPLFVTPKGFTNALKGRGLFGTVLDVLGVQKPIQVLSDKQVQDAVSTESKVFSIYATGRSGTGKNEARVRVHAVVDFRGAPPPGVAQATALADLAAALGGGQTPPVAPASSSGGAQANLPDGATGDTIAAAFQKSAAGNIVYYRID